MCDEKAPHLRGMEDIEDEKLVRFHQQVVDAWETARNTTRKGSHFFFGQKLRRLVREALEEYGDEV